jgi:hypothetical protein
MEAGEDEFLQLASALQALKVETSAPRTVPAGTGASHKPDNNVVRQQQGCR